MKVNAVTRSVIKLVMLISPWTVSHIRIIIPICVVMIIMVIIMMSIVIIVIIVIVVFVMIIVMWGSCFYRCATNTR